MLLRYKAQPASASSHATCAAVTGGRAFIAEQRLRHIAGWPIMPAMHMHTEALAGRGETCRWMSAAAGASGDRVLASLYDMYTYNRHFNRATRLEMPSRRIEIVVYRLILVQ